MTGIAVRGEWVGNSIKDKQPAGTQNQWAVTLTADHHLTDNLMVRGEFRYDGADVNGSEARPCSAVVVTVGAFSVSTTSSSRSSWT